MTGTAPQREAVLVTGGSSGIGRAIAERFARPGVDVFVNYRAREAPAQDAAEAISARGATPYLVKADVGTETGAADLIAIVQQRAGRLDQLVHCAAATHSGPLLHASREELLKCIEVNALGLLSLVGEALPLFAPGSSVIYVSSRGARSVLPSYGALGVAKALGEQLVRYLAAEVAGRGIRVNTISVGAVDTAAFRSMFPDDHRQRLERAAAANPSGRGVMADDAAELAWMLSRPELAMVQGQTVTVDGGASL
jgi:enoyl-[acyl-carrier protein] reductase III